MLIPRLLLPLLSLVLLAACQNTKGPVGTAGPLAGVVITGVDSDPALSAATVAQPCAAAEGLLASAADGQVLGHRLVALAEECVKRGSNRPMGQALLGYGLQQIGQPREGLQALKNLLGYSNAAQFAAQPGSASARVLGFEARSYFYAASGRWKDAVLDLDNAIAAQQDGDALLTGVLLARQGFYKSLGRDNAGAENSFAIAEERLEGSGADLEVVYQRGLAALGRRDWPSAGTLLGQVYEQSGQSYRRTQAMLMAYFADVMAARDANLDVGPAVSAFESRAARADAPPALAPFVELLQGRIGPEEARAKAKQNPKQNVEASLAQAYWYLGIYHTLRDEAETASRAWSRGIGERVTTQQEILLMQSMQRRFGV